MNIKHVLSIAILSSILIYSCAKSTATNDNELSNLSATTKAAIVAPNLATLKQSYSLLSNDEKQKLWDTKWDAILKNDAGQLTETQKGIISSIKQFVDKKTIASLMKDPTDGEQFIKVNLSSFENYFSKAQLYMIIECPYFCEDFSIFKSMDYLTKIDQRLVENSPSPDSVGASNCECYYSISCSLSLKTCVDGKCTKNANCGLTGTSNCTGMCK